MHDFTLVILCDAASDGDCNGGGPHGNRSRLLCVAPQKSLMMFAPVGDLIVFVAACDGHAGD